jgi:flagellar hook-length control protein FliK
MEMAPEGERKAAPPVDSSTSPISLEEVSLKESTGKMDIPPGSVKKTFPFSDSLASPVSLEESLPKESAGKIESSAGGEKKSIRPSTPQESNGSEKRPVQESNDFFPRSQPSLEMETNPDIREMRVPKKQGPTFGAAKGAVEPAIPQNLQERASLLGNRAYILDSTDRESGTPFSANAGKGQEKVLWTGPDIRPLAAREVQSPPSFFAAFTDPLNHQVENGGEIKEASAPLSERPDPQSVFQQVGQRVLWLVRNNEERIRITLEPPELGQVFLEIDRHKEHIKTILWTDNPTTKASLETSQGEIQRIIESEGFKLEKFDVFVQQDPGWFQGRKEDARKPDSWEARMPAEEKGSSANSTESIPGRTPAPHLASRYLNLLV